MADTNNTDRAKWKFNALYADTEVRSAAYDKLMAVVYAGPEQAPIVGALKAADKPGTALLRGEGEQFTRFCPGCGSVGEVDAKFQDCCPDGSGARLIPASLAQKCHDLFLLALVGASQPELSESQPNAALADGWMPMGTAPKDGTYIDLWSCYGHRDADAYWGLPPHECGEMGRLCDSDWHDYQPGWVTDFWSEPQPDSNFTHWRRRPAPPTLNASKGDAQHG